MTPAQLKTYGIYTLAVVGGVDVVRRTYNLAFGAEDSITIEYRGRKATAPIASVEDLVSWKAIVDAQYTAAEEAEKKAEAAKESKKAKKAS